MEITINVYPQQQNVEIVTEPNVTNINVTTYAVINPQVYDLSEFTNTEVDRFAKLSDIVSSIAGYATEAWVNSRGFITNVITALGFTPENVANKNTSTSLGTSDSLYPTQNAVKTYVDTGLSAKQNSLGFTPENVSNKNTSTSLGTSDSLYPTQNAVKTYVDTGLSAKQDSLGFTPENVANKENTTLDTSTTKYPTNRLVKEAVDAKQNSLGFTPENVANKATSLVSPNNTTYPTTQTVADGLALKQNTLTNPITGTGASGQVAFFNGATTQIGDSGLFWDNTNKRLGIGATPATDVRLDVRAQGALSTDIAFRVRNSADTRNFLTVNGLGDVFNNGAGGVTTNTFYGENAGRNTTANNNSFFGTSAGRNNTTGASNSFFGTSAGFSNTTGNNNSFFGQGAGQSNTTGGFNSFFGQGAGASNTTANNNSFFGQNAGTSNTTGGNNTAIGLDALRFTTTGGFNTAIGANALRNNTTGGNNTAIGLNALRNNTTAGGNTAIGLTALESNITGGSNTSIGFQTLLSNTTGGSNTAIGANALVSNVTGNSNTAIGLDAARRISGGTNLTIANNSVFLGQDTRALNDNETNQIVIGHTAIGSGSNTATIGNTSIVDTVLRGRVNIQQYATGSRPAYVKGALIYDSTLSKLVVGGATGWEVVTSL